MLGLRIAVVLSTLVLGFFASPATHYNQKHGNVVDWDEFNALLDSIDSDSIHHALHSLAPKFQDGVFSKDRSALEQVHSENPMIASKLVHLAKRQSGSNTTTTTTTSTPTPSTPAESSASSSSASASSSRAASVSSVLSSAILATTVPSPTTILVAPTTPNSAVAVSTTKGAVIFSTIGGGLVTLTSSNQDVSFKPSTSTHLYYTTLGDGAVSTSTSTVVVNAPQTAGGGDAAGVSGSAGSASSSNAPGLQNGGSTTRDAGFVGELFILLGSAAAFLFAL